MSPNDSLNLDWPDCAFPGCKAKSCLRLDSPHCYSHTLKFIKLAPELLDALEQLTLGVFQPLRSVKPKIERAMDVIARAKAGT